MKEFLGSTMGRVVVIVVSALIIYGLIAIGVSCNIQALALITFIVCGVFGWRALNAITPDIFLFMSIAGWAVYFLIKGILSVVIGAFIAPFQIGKMVADFVCD